MIPAEFDYYAPTSVGEVISLLQQHGGEAKVLAGGHSLIPMLKLRLSSPPVLVDIGRIPELRGITRTNGTVTIGAMTTHAQVESSKELRDTFPIMAEAASVIGDPMVRNRGTFGGALAHADPAADWPAVALALGAQMRVIGPGGERIIPVDDFFVDMLTSALEPDEVLTRIDIPVSNGKTGMSYQKFQHPASGYAVVGVATVVTLGADGACQGCRVAVTGAGPRATRQTAVEDALKGQRLTPELIAQASERAGEGMDFLGDIYASEGYRAHLTKVYTKRALLAALEAAS
jgi:carbon-monoxide dehydrogenase medium subunit